MTVRDHEWVTFSTDQGAACVCQDCGCVARRLEASEQWEFHPIGKFWVWVWQPCSLQPWMIS